MSAFEDLDKVIQANGQQFKEPGAVTVRPGYKIRDGWITVEPAIVVTVRHKTANLNPGEAIPGAHGRNRHRRSRGYDDSEASL